MDGNIEILFNNCNFNLRSTWDLPDVSVSVPDETHSYKIKYNGAWIAHCPAATTLHPERFSSILFICRVSLRDKFYLAKPPAPPVPSCLDVSYFFHLPAVLPEVAL